MGCSIEVVKYLLYFFNFIFTIVGSGLLALGILLRERNNDIAYFIPDKYHLELPPLLLIIIGSAIIIVVLIGCCGAARESTCLLSTFAVFVLTLLIVQVAIGSYAFLEIGDTEDLRVTVRDTVERVFNEYHNSSTANQTAAIEQFNFLQHYFQCCGVDGPGDWKFDHGKLPKSCCKGNTECTILSTDSFQTGCNEKAYNWFKGTLDVLGILAFTVASIEIIGAIFALCLSSSIKNQLRRDAYA